jgi:beta-lactamase regulating signal transducer with metallopeptidase domain
MSTLLSLLDGLSARLLWTSVQACLLIGAVALACRFLPRLPAAVRCALWWLVGAQLIVGLAWHTPRELRWLPAPAETAAEVVDLLPAAATPYATRVAPAHVVPAPGLPAEAAPLSWRRILLTLWLGGVLLQLVLMARHGWRTARTRRGAVPAPPGWQATSNLQARRLGLRRAPRLALSPSIGSPQVLGAWRPLMLFPAHACLSDEETALAIANELAHLRRGDLWLGWIPVLAQRLFFFHPLVAWATREYALSREAACDAQALAYTGGAPQAYGKLLLRLGVASPLPSGLAGASPTFHNLKRRLTMLQHIEASPRRSPGWLLLVAIAVAGVVPYRVTAGDTTRAAAQAHQVAPPVPAAPAAPSFAPPPPPPVPDAPPARPPAPPAVPPAPPAMPPAPPAMPPAPPTPPPAPPAMPPAPPTPPPAPPAAPPAPPAPPQSAEYDGMSARQVYIDSGSQADGGFALMDDQSIVVTAPPADLPAIKRLRKSSGAPLLWFRHDGRAYVIHDPATLAQAHEAYDPLTELARERGKLAGKQGKLAGKLAGLAARGAAFAREQADLARLQADLAREAIGEKPGAASEAARQARERRHQELQAQQARLQQKQAAIEKAIASQRHPLEAQQAGFERQQRALATRQQQVEHQAQQKMQQLLQEAIRQGKAQSASAR